VHVNLADPGISRNQNALPESLQISANRLDVERGAVGLEDVDRFVAILGSLVRIPTRC